MRIGLLNVCISLMCLRVIRAGPAMSYQPAIEDFVKFVEERGRETALGGNPPQQLSAEEAADEEVYGQVEFWKAPDDEYFRSWQSSSPRDDETSGSEGDQEYDADQPEDEMESVDQGKDERKISDQESDAREFSVQRGEDPWNWTPEVPYERYKDIGGEKGASSSAEGILEVSKDQEEIGSEEGHEWDNSASRNAWDLRSSTNLESMKGIKNLRVDVFDFIRVFCEKEPYRFVACIFLKALYPVCKDKGKRKQMLSVLNEALKDLEKKGSESYLYLELRRILKKIYTKYLKNLKPSSNVYSECFSNLKAKIVGKNGRLHNRMDFFQMVGNNRQFKKNVEHRRAVYGGLLHILYRLIALEKAPSGCFKVALPTKPIAKWCAYQIYDRYILEESRRIAEVVGEHKRFGHLLSPFVHAVVARANEQKLGYRAGLLMLYSTLKATFIQLIEEVQCDAVRPSDLFAAAMVHAIMFSPELLAVSLSLPHEQDEKDYTCANVKPVLPYDKASRLEHPLIVFAKLMAEAVHNADDKYRHKRHASRWDKISDGSMKLLHIWVLQKPIDLCRGPNNLIESKDMDTQESLADECRNILRAKFNKKCSVTVSPMKERVTTSDYPSDSDETDISDE